MDSFTFHNATKIIFGRGAESKVGTETARHSSRVLLHWGQGSVERSGLLDRVKASLKSAGVAHVDLPGARPNPRLSLVREGVDLCRREGIDFILAVGGGSVIDSAKAIAVGVPYAGEVWDFFEGSARPEAALKVGCVLTIPAAGSETSGSAVITKEEGLLKRGLTSNEHLRPVFSIMDPELTCTLPAKDTAIGAADIMAHVMERYFTNTREVDLSDRLCEAVMAAVRRNLPRVLADLSDVDARAELMWTGTQAHSDLIGMGRVGDWASHDIEHELSAAYDVPHGAGLAVVFPAWMKQVHRHDPARFAQWARRVWEVEDYFAHPEEMALEGIRRLEEFYRRCGLPVRLGELGIGPDRLAELAGKATGGGARKLGNFVKLDEAAVLAVLRSAL
jgi:alcohol dehydrogenase